MATEQDAARDRVLAARADFREQVDVLEASVREAVDIPAKVRRSPGKAAAVVGLLAVLILRVRTARRPRQGRPDAEADAAGRGRKDPAEAR